MAERGKSERATQPDPSSRSLAVRAAVGLIHGYRLLLSPWIGRQCRFYPTCSVYAEEAIAEHGLVRGVWLAARRIGKCHPFHPGGVDLVPDSRSRRH